jgi:hypothetical protein
VLDRGDPAISGMPRATLAGRRARWAVALLGSGALLFIGLFFWGGFRGFAEGGMVGGHTLELAGGVLQAAAVALVVAGAVVGLAAAVLGTSAIGARSVIALILMVPVGAAILAATMLFVPLIGVLGVLVGAAVLLVVAAAAPAAARAATLGSPRRRVLLALPWTALTLAAVVTGSIHITIWNPLARVPGLTLDEIYAAMAAAGEGTGAVMIVAWAALWSIAALALPLLCAIPRLIHVLPRRRILVLGLLTLGGTITFQWFAGFAMGMGLADTFYTSGGDAAVSGPLLTIVGMLALVAATLFGFAPARRPVATPA